MLRFLPGVLLLQLVACTLLWLNLDIFSGDRLSWLGVARLLIPMLVVGLLTAFWFGALSRHLADQRVANMKDEFAKEREKLKLQAEKSKARVVQKSHKTIARESRRTHAKANFKVGAALTGLVAFGVFMTFTQFALTGLLLLAGSGVALGGLALRQRRIRKLDRDNKPAPLWRRLGSSDNQSRHD